MHFLTLCFVLARKEMILPIRFAVILLALIESYQYIAYNASQGTTKTMGKRLTVDQELILCSHSCKAKPSQHKLPVYKEGT